MVIEKSLTHIAAKIAKSIADDNPHVGVAPALIPSILKGLRSHPAPTRLERIYLGVKTDKQTGCWNWQHGKNASGYGFIETSSGKRLPSHRVSYEEHVGPIPVGYVIDHLCRNKSCCNPLHLEPVTRRENTYRAFAPTHVRVCEGATR